MVNSIFWKIKYSNFNLLSASYRILLLVILYLLSPTVFSQIHKKIGQVNDFKKYLQLTAIGNNEKLIQTSDSNLSIMVNERKSHNDKTTITGVVKGSKGSNFNFKFSLLQLDGTIVIPESKKAFKYFSDLEGSVFVKEVDIDSLLCVDYPEYIGDIKGSPLQGAPPPTSNVYHLQSRPGVPYVIMLDFDGQVVTNANWNGGTTINAQAADVTETDITNIWKGMIEDYSPFNLNITTDEAVFQAAPLGQRIRCIFTPTNYFYQNAGGVAYIGSFLWTDDTPCWSFYYSQKLGMEVGSHEVGHTLGLVHDGRILSTGNEEYYSGQGDWAPIMGVGYYVNLTQWSKGEYQFANNNEDDIALIGGTNNKFGFVNDDVGNTIGTSKPLTMDASGTLLNNQGVITSKSDIDYYSFTTKGGSTTLNVSPNLIGPDLDIIINILDASGILVATDNPTTSYSASITTTLVAGTYYLRIDGTGMGDPFTNGYSDYSSIGQYTISGTVPVNTGNCTASGSILREYWANVAGYAISSIPVNATPTSTSFLNSFDGPINFADNFGARYRGYICPPATGNYTFWISSDDNSELWLSTNDNPSNKVKIASVTGWNLVGEWEKYPSQKSASINLVAGQRYYIEALHKDATSDDHLSVGWQLPNSTLERPIPGNRLSPYGVTNNPPLVSITSPTDGQSFTAPAAITINAYASDSDGSIVKVEFYQGNTKLGEDATSPYSFDWTGVAQGSYTLTAKAFDNGGAQTTSSVINIFVNGTSTCTATGNILCEVWQGITGTTVSSIPVNTTPTIISSLTMLEGPINAGDNYGTRLRGYICPPVSGDYIFWIASNDNSELWLSTNDSPNLKIKIAFVTGSTASREWEKYASQKSVAISLSSSQRYYIEVLHKEGTGSDNVAVGWQLPNAVLERPIPGNRLSPFIMGNNPPTVSISNPTEGQSFNSPANITINANASDLDGNVTKVEFYQGSTKLGEDVSIPYSFSWSNVGVGAYVLTAVAYDNKGAQTTSVAVNILVTTSISTCTATGTILREVWTGITGTTVSTIPVNTSPTSSNQLTILEAPANIGDNYGTRIRGYVCPPVSGGYIFWVESNDNSELWLSSSDNPNLKSKIAFVNGATAPREWEKFTSQKSATINLTAGQKYYIEVLHKEGVGTDHVAVGWQLPNAVQERPIPGNRLSPFAGGNNPPSVSITSPTNGQSFAAPATVSITANATDTDGSVTKVEFYQGSTKLGEDVTTPYSFNWTNVAAGNYTLTAKAFDNGGASTTSSSVSIIVTGVGCTASGTILREVWNGVAGSTVNLIPTQVAPNSTSQVSIFEGPSNVGINYGARYRGYICVPTTGAYRFWISSNDNSELWLSTNDNPTNKVKIASVTGFTGIREWTKYPSQQSALINLVAGQRYYIEALHKQGSGTDNLAVGWQLPNNTLERPIPGNRLSPSTGSQTLAAPISFLKEVNTKGTLNDSISVNIFPNPAEKGFVTLTIEGYEQTKQKAIIEIKDLSGNVIYKNKVSCDITCHRTIINIDEKFITGIYIVEVKVGDNVFFKRLQIE